MLFRSINATEFAARAKEKGLLLSALGPNFVRLVTHLDIDDESTDKAGKILVDLLQSAFVAK